MKKRLRRALKAVAVWCRLHRNDDLERQWTTLNAKLRATTNTTDDGQTTGVSGGSTEPFVVFGSSG
jgi:hypothetical protein